MKLNKLFLALAGISAVSAGFAGSIVFSANHAAEPAVADAVNGEKRFTILFNLASFWPSDNAIIKVTYGGAGAVVIPKDSDLTSGTETHTNFNVVTFGETTYYAVSMVVNINDFTYANFYFDRINPSTGISWNNSGWVLTPSNVKNGYDNTIMCDNNSVFSMFGLYYKVTLHTGLGLANVSSSLVYGGSAFSPADPAALEGYNFKGWYTDSALTNPYSAVTLSGDYNLYAKYEMNATGFANDFLSNTASECASGSVSSSTWTDLKTEYSSLNSTEQKVITDASPLVTGTAVEQCAARYDVIMNKYSAFNDFASRSLGHSAAVVAASDNSSVLVLGSIAALAILAAAGYFFVRKRKAD